MPIAIQHGSEQLRDWMKRREFTQDEAAVYLGIDEAVMSKLARGARNAGLKIAILIERKTGIPVEAWTSDPADVPKTDGRANRRNSR